MTFYQPKFRIPIRSRFPQPGSDNDTNDMGSSGSTSAAAPESASAPTSDSPTNSPYFPNAHDVLNVRRMLQHAVRDNPTTPAGLPTELVDIIIDTAEYWPSVKVKMQEKMVVKKIRGEDREYAMIINQDRDRECLRTGPLCYATPDGSTSPQLQPYRDLHPCRKVEFTIRSHDQGFGGGPGTRGTYNGSHTWFDAYVIPRPGCADPSRPDPQPQKDWKETERKGRDKEKSNDDDRSSSGNASSEQPDDDDDDDSEETRYSHHNYFLFTAYSLQRNKVAQDKTQTHTITWHHLDSIDPDSAEAEEIQNSSGRGGATLDGRVVRRMNVGDEISVWGRARFPGWSNRVEGMSIRVFWAV